MTALAAQKPPPDALYEIVDGEYKELPPMSTHAVIIASLLVSHINVFTLSKGLGIAACEALLGLSARAKRKYYLGT